MSSRVRQSDLPAPRLLILLLTGAVLVAATSGCGAAQRPRASSSVTSSLPGINTSLSPTSERGTITTSNIPPGQRVRGDGDADNPGDIDGNGDIDPEDHDSDYPTPQSYRFPDADDRTTFAYGQVPTAAEEATITQTVKSYYAAAAKKDGVAACSLLSPSIASSVPESYGGAAGPSYLRGGKTCAAVMSLLFTHLHEELSEAVEVLEVRVEHTSAQVVLSSRKMRASYIFLARHGDSWRVAELIGQPLP